MTILAVATVGIVAAGIIGYISFLMPPAPTIATVPRMDELAVKVQELNAENLKLKLALDECRRTEAKRPQRQTPIVRDTIITIPPVDVPVPLPPMVMPPKLPELNDDD